MIDAQSISNIILPLCQREELALTILSRHEHAWNFQTSAGEIIALVTSYHGNGPFHIVLRTALPPLAQSAQNTVAQVQQGTLCVGSLYVNLKAAATWSATLPALAQPPTTVGTLLHTVQRQFAPSPLFTGTAAIVQRAQQGMATLQRGLTAGDSDMVQTGVIHLAGLGPGLTPAGDDFLVGVLAALHAWPVQHVQPLIRQHSLAIAATATKRTTQLSGAWLRYAGEGYFGEAWHHLIMALNTDTAAIAAAAARILSTGATSGADAMSGFLWGVAVLEKRMKDEG